ncbi:MAG: hypothetical protein IJO94_03920 [Firmicutes bacterium]|nr:hypothetical protein [Bacillota bacterium]
MKWFLVGIEPPGGNSSVGCLVAAVVGIILISLVVALIALPGILSESLYHISTYLIMVGSLVINLVLFFYYKTKKQRFKIVALETVITTAMISIFYIKDAVLTYYDRDPLTDMIMAFGGILVLFVYFAVLIGIASIIAFGILKMVSVNKK